MYTPYFGGALGESITKSDRKTRMSFGIEVPVRFQIAPKTAPSRCLYAADGGRHRQQRQGTLSRPYGSSLEIVYGLQENDLVIINPNKKNQTGVKVALFISGQIES